MVRPQSVVDSELKRVGGLPLHPVGAVASERGAEGPSGAPAKHAASVPTLPLHWDLAERVQLLENHAADLQLRVIALESLTGNQEAVIAMCVDLTTTLNDQVGRLLAVVETLEQRPLLCSCCSQLDAIAERGAA